MNNQLTRKPVGTPFSVLHTLKGSPMKGLWPIVGGTILLMLIALAGCDSDGGTQVDGVDGAVSGATATNSQGTTCTETSFGTYECGGNLGASDIITLTGNANTFIDADYDESTTGDRRTAPNLLLEAPGDVAAVTPITTLVRRQVAAGLSRSEAEAAVASALGISTDALFITPRNTGSASNADVASAIAAILEIANLAGNSPVTSLSLTDTAAISNTISTTASSIQTSLTGGTSATAASASREGELFELITITVGTGGSITTGTGGGGGTGDTTQ